MKNKKLFHFKVSKLGQTIHVDKAGVLRPDHIFILKLSCILSCTTMLLNPMNIPQNKHYGKPPRSCYKSLMIPLNSNLSCTLVTLCIALKYVKK